MFTIGGEANHGALQPIGLCVVHAGVAALILDGDGLDGELAFRQGGGEPRSSLVSLLDHGVAPLCEGGHLLGVSFGRRVPPRYLLHLFWQTVGAREGHLLTRHCCFVAFYGDLS